MKSWKILASVLALLLAFGGCDLGGAPTPEDPNLAGGGGTEVDGISGTVVDLQGRSVANARVQVFPEATSGLAKGFAGYAAIHDSARTNAKGEYLVDSLPAGTYALLARTVRNDTVLIVLVRGIVHDGGRRNLGEITLEPAGKISIKVQSEGNAVIDAQCTITGLDDYKAVSSVNGTCVLSGLPAGSFRVTIVHPLLGSAETGAIVVQPGTTTNGGQVELEGGPGAEIDTLVAHWDFEDNAGNVLRDVTGSHNGIFVGTANLQPDGVKGKSLHLDGSNYARVPASGEFSRLSSFTLAAWVWQDAQTLDEPVMEFSEPDTLGVHVWLNTSGNEDVIPGRVYANTVPIVQTTPDASVLMHGQTLATTGRWNHVAYTYDAAARTARLYLNGSQIASSILPASAPAKVGDFYLGYRPLNSKVGRKGATLRGRLDEVKVWSRALSASDVLSQASQAGSGSEVVLPVTADTYVNRSSSGSGVHLGNNFGAVSGFLVGVYDLNTIPTGLLQFQLPQGVSSARITKAVMRVHSFGWTIKNAHPANITVRLHKVLRSWKEGTGNGTANSAAVDGVTALERFWGTQNGAEDWSTASIGFNDVDASAASTSVTKANGYNGVWEFDVTAQAKAWADAPAQNFGVLLRVDIPATNEVVEDYPAFHSRESTVAETLKPQLVLTLD
jgi:hypothetical protein